VSGFVEEGRADLNRQSSGRGKDCDGKFEEIIRSIKCSCENQYGGDSRDVRRSGDNRIGGSIARRRLCLDYAEVLDVKETG